MRDTDEVKAFMNGKKRALLTKRIFSSHYLEVRGSYMSFQTKEDMQAFEREFTVEEDTEKASVIIGKYLGYPSFACEDFATKKYQYWAHRRVFMTVPELGLLFGFLIENLEKAEKWAEGLEYKLNCLTGETLERAKKEGMRRAIKEAERKRKLNESYTGRAIKETEVYVPKVKIVPFGK